MAKLTIDEIIELGKISIPLASEYQAQGALFGPRKAVLAPQTIALVTDAVRWQWESFPNTVGIGAKATLTVLDAGSTGDSIDVTVNDPIYGYIVLGSLVRTPSEGKVDLLAQAIANSINQNIYGYTATVNNNVITVIAGPDTGAELNGVPLIAAISSGEGVDISTEDLDFILTENSINLIIE